MKKKNIHAVALGRLGGMAGSGKAKARTSEQARAAAMVRVKKMKNRAFTIIELLVVITIIAILAGMVTPMFLSAKERAREAKARVEVKALETAFKSYLDTYKTWPATWADGPINGDIFTTLQGSGPNNSQGIAFYEFASFTNTSMDQTTAWDSWSNPSDQTTWQAYQVKFDKDYDNKIDNLPEVYRSVVVWSEGKNRSSDVNGDGVVTSNASVLGG